MADVSPHDLELMQSLHQIIQETQKGSDRRRQPRHHFRCTQLMAPFDGEQMPAASAFVQVDCHDISSGGFAYYASELPEHEYLMLALGRAPFLFLVARVVRSEVVELADRVEYLIGCRLVKRISP